VSLCEYCISRQGFSDIGGTAEVEERRVCIKFCVRLGKTGSETFESMVYAYDPETKLQSSQWKSPGFPRPKKARMKKKQIEDDSHLFL
jgi:hypothetical protein